MTNETKNKIIELRNKGVSIRNISKSTGIPRSTISSFILKVEDESCNLNSCKHCGVALKNIKGKKKKVFCSYECRMKYWKEHNDEINHKSKVQKKCEYCGKEYIDYPSRRKRFCSYECYKHYEMERKDG